MPRHAARDARRRLVRELSVCPVCRAALDASGDPWVCRVCRRRFPLERGVPHLRAEPPDAREREYVSSLRGRLRSNRLLYRLVSVALPVMRTGPDPAVAVAPALRGPQSLVLDVGGGNDRRHESFVNVDVLGYPEVDVVADATALPFGDGAAAGMVSIAVLEHVRDPRALLHEAHRVLEPGGSLVLVAPFLAPFHAAPDDYRRWSAVGLAAEVEAAGFAVEATGVNGGPASAMAWFLGEWLAFVFSAGRPRLRRWLSPLLQAACSPLKLLDLALTRWEGSADLAATVYVHAERRHDPARRETVSVSWNG